MNNLCNFLTAVFLPDDLIEVRWIETWRDENGDKKSKVWNTEFATPTEVLKSWTWYLRLAERTRSNLFFGVCPRPYHGATKSHQITTVRCLWSDLDYCTADEAILRCASGGLVRPSIVVNTGHGVHLYWLLDRAQPGGDEVGETLEGIKRVCGGDKTTDLARILRLPSSMNRKGERNGLTPVPCVLVYCEEVRYPLSVFQSFRVAPEKEIVKTRTTSPTAEQTEQIPPSNNKNNEKYVPLDSLTEQRRWFLENGLNTCGIADDRSKRDFLTMKKCVLWNLDPDEVWQLAKDKGKFAGVRKEKYFSPTWEAAMLAVSQER